MYRYRDSIDTDGRFRRFRHRLRPYARGIPPKSSLVLLSEHWAIWSLLRFVTGIGISGCYIIIESWLNEQTTDDYRGRVLATYSILVLLAMSAGQLLLDAEASTSVNPVVFAAVLLSLSVIPLSLVRVQQPALPHSIEFALGDVFRSSPAAVGASFGIGTVTGSLFTMTPVAGSLFGLDPQQCAFAMMALVIGGALLQMPAGKLSDRADRRKVAAGVLVIGSATAVLALWLLYCLVRRSAPTEHTNTFVLTAKSSPELLSLDPRVEEPASEKNEDYRQ